ncbi:hypothetical protein PVAP13_7NG056289 [Panicum virgatum]|uniref:Uncharacterized protein n=1 Tax=Panicum virgatum TaxID=38727 RepID=A0A8T0Q1P4_PANVG|nr:hypothetical protein PVAP13_7NG056289 [Panicum virgatum]
MRARLRPLLGVAAPHGGRWPGGAGPRAGTRQAAPPRRDTSRRRWRQEARQGSGHGSLQPAAAAPSTAVVTPAGLVPVAPREREREGGRRSRPLTGRERWGEREGGRDPQENKDLG